MYIQSIKLGMVKIPGFATGSDTQIRVVISYRVGSCHSAVGAPNSSSVNQVRQPQRSSGLTSVKSLDAQKCNDTK